MTDVIHFTPEQRQVFRYVDETGQARSADPMEIRGALAMEALARGTTIDKLIDAANLRDENVTEQEVAEGWRAAFQLAEIVAKVFGFTPLSKEAPGGMDMGNLLGCLHAFNVYLEKKNLTLDSQPTSTPPTASTSAA